MDRIPHHVALARSDREPYRRGTSVAFSDICCLIIRGPGLMVARMRCCATIHDQGLSMDPRS